MKLASHLAQLREGLADPAAYPHPADDLEVHETHISLVFLAGDFAYKLKKPVVLDFLDYGTLERRRHFCREEVSLNRRLAPEVYLGVVPVVRTGDRLRFDVVPPAGDEAAAEAAEAAAGQDAEIVEWAVRMRRLPDEHTLETRVERDTARPEEVEHVAVHLADFHARAERGPEIARYGRFDAVARNARDNFEQSRDQVGETVHRDVFRRLARLTEEALKRHRPRIEERGEGGMTRDTHGDLRLDHVYFLPDREAPVILDCIEFNPAFRYADPVSDMAFLAMDLEQAGRRDLAARFADAYFEASGDGEGRELLDFYVAYRAAVRGKVQGIKAADPDIPTPERQTAAATATGHWLLALGTLAPPAERPGLVLVGGLPGVGKTTLARALAERAGLQMIRSDVVRKELAGLGPDESAAAAFGEGLYGPEWTKRTYRECRRRAEEILFHGGRVIVDASFHREARRREFLEAAVRNGVRVLFLECRAPREVVRRRLARRADGASDAGLAVYGELEERWEDPGAAIRRIRAAVDTGGEPDASVRRALEALRDAGLHGTS